MTLENIKLDIDYVRSQFPAFKDPLCKDWSFFENAGGSYVPKNVIDKLTEFMTSTKVQPYAEYPMSKIAGENMDKATNLFAKMINAKNNEILIYNSYSLNKKEKEVIKIIYDLPVVIKNSCNELSPALIANYLYDLVKSYNSLYQNFNILNSESKESTSVRLLISLKTRDIIKICSELLGIDLPNKM